MDDEKRTYTTKDIAKLANVSRGTVDRVLHKRGKVSSESEQKVLAVLEKIDYRPNALGKALQASKGTLIVALVPSGEEDEFWYKSATGIEEAEEAFYQYNNRVKIIFYNQDNLEDFLRATEEALALKPNGIAIAPFFYRESLLFFEKCKALHIPVITFNTEIKVNADLPFVGQNLYQSGQVAASLIHSTTPLAGEILILHFDEHVSNAAHMQEKERGFRAYFEKINSDKYKITTANITGSDSSQLLEQLDTLFSEAHEIVAAFVTTSKGFKLAQYISDNQINCKVVGYDLMIENIPYLKNGTIDFLIHQNPKAQACMAVSQLAEKLIMKKEISNYTHLPLGIIIKENINSYL